MKEITLITSNTNKLIELEAIFPDDIPLRAQAIDLEEIQGDGDPRKIIEDKLRRGHDTIKGPVIVEDVSAELACLNGLPGPFIKYFEQRMGKGALWELAKNYNDHSVTIRCLMGYLSSKDMIIVEGVLDGEVVSPRGDRGFGFDFVFKPNGYNKTTAQMSTAEKNQMSHRALAAKMLVKQLQALGS